MVIGHDQQLIVRLGNDDAGSCCLFLLAVLLPEEIAGLREFVVHRNDGRHDLGDHVGYIRYRRRVVVRRLQGRIGTGRGFLRAGTCLCTGAALRRALIILSGSAAGISVLRLLQRRRIRSALGGGLHGVSHSVGGKTCADADCRAEGNRQNCPSDTAALLPVLSVLMILVSAASAVISARRTVIRSRVGAVGAAVRVAVSLPAVLVLTVSVILPCAVVLVRSLILIPAIILVRTIVLVSAVVLPCAALRTAVLTAGRLSIRAAHSLSVAGTGLRMICISTVVAACSGIHAAVSRCFVRLLRMHRLFGSILIVLIPVVSFVAHTGTSFPDPNMFSLLQSAGTPPLCRFPSPFPSWERR